MSEYNLKLRQREEKIRVAEIIERSENKGAVGLPHMVVRDQKGRRHTLMALDFISSEWEGIRVGSIIVVTMKEAIGSARVLTKS